MLVSLGVNEHPALEQEFDDLWVRVKDVHSRKVLHFRNESAGGIDRVIDLEAVLLPYVKVVGTVPGSRVNTACPRFSSGLIFKTHIQLYLGIGLAQRDVIAVHQQ